MVRRTQHTLQKAVSFEQLQLAIKKGNFNSAPTKRELLKVYANLLILDGYSLFQSFQLLSAARLFSDWIFSIHCWKLQITL
jgi:hypothetical protein